MRIRTAAPSDASAVAALISLAYRVEDFFTIGDRTNEDDVRTRMKKSTFLLLEDGSGAMAGCVYVDVRGDTGYFGMLSVDPARQGQGLGSRLIAIPSSRMVFAVPAANLAFSADASGATASVIGGSAARALPAAPSAIVVSGTIASVASAAATPAPAVVTTSATPAAAVIASATTATIVVAAAASAATVVTSAPAPAAAISTAAASRTAAVATLGICG